MTRATFTTHGRQSVTVEYTDVLSDLPQCRTFIAKGRYVFELIGVSGRERQVCERLQIRGVTLMIDADADLLPIIRAEYQKMRRADKKLALAL